MRKKRILTGLQPTGVLHLGNYFGAIRSMVELQNEGELFLFIADLHALTNLSNEQNMHDKVAFEKTCNDLIRGYIACGIDPKKVTIYRQSEFPQITELMWIFNCLLKFQFLTIGHAYKDALQNKKDPGLGIFLYPTLMAADILLPNAHIVPIGKDQVQHVEIAREIARKFNTVTKTQYFVEPQERLEAGWGNILGIDGEKMSKSKGNILPIFADEEEIQKKIASIVTDSTPAGSAINTQNSVLCNYLKLLLPSKEYGSLQNLCSNGSVTYKELKEQLLQAHLSYFHDARTKYKKLEKNSNYIEKALGYSRKRVDKLLTERLNEIRSIIGLGTPPRNNIFKW